MKVFTCERCGVGLAFVHMKRNTGRYGWYMQKLYEDGKYNRILLQHPCTGFCKNDDQIGSVADEELKYEDGALMNEKTV